MVDNKELGCLSIWCISISVLTDNSLFWKMLGKFKILICYTCY